MPETCVKAIVRYLARKELVRAIYFTFGLKEFSILDMASANVFPSGSEPLPSQERIVQLPPVEAVSRDQREAKGRVGWLAAGGLALVMGVVTAGEKLGILPQGTLGKGFDSALNIFGSNTVRQELNGLYAEGRGDHFENDLDLVLHHRVGTLVGDWSDYFSDFPQWYSTDIASWPAAEKANFELLDQNQKDQITWIIGAVKKVSDLKKDRQILIDAAAGYLEQNPPRSWTTASSENRRGIAMDAFRTVADKQLPAQTWRFSAVPKKATVLTAGVNGAD